MAADTSFVGIGLRLQRVTQTALSTIRVRFTQYVLMNSGANGALNIDNYTLSGPETNYITAITAVDGDPQAVDMAIAAPLSTGLWQLTAANIKTTEGGDLELPAVASFSVILTETTPNLTGGTENDDAEMVIRKHMSPALKGDTWEAVIKALASGDTEVREFNKNAFDQLFKSTASGMYLDRKAADSGLKRPPQLGMPDDLFRQYLIKATAGKLTHEVILQILEVFYGSESVRAYQDSGLSQPFELYDGAKLNVKVDERDTVEVVFNEDEFDQITQARALEVALSITRAFRKRRLKAFAVPVTDPETGVIRVRMYSGALGLGSGIRTLGGTAQNFLQFPELIDTYSGTLSGGEPWEEEEEEVDDPPAVPENLLAALTSEEDGIITVTWDENVEPDFESYDVQRSSNAGADWEDLDVSFVAEYVDSPGEGTWIYRARARDAADNLSDWSDPSNEITIEPPAELIGPPTILTAVGGVESFTLTLEDPAGISSLDVLNTYIQTDPVGWDDFVPGSIAGEFAFNMFVVPPGTYTVRARIETIDGLGAWSDYFGPFTVT